MNKIRCTWHVLGRPLVLFILPSKNNTNQDYIKNCRTLRWVRGLK